MALLHDPEFWVLVGFLIFFILLGRTFWTLMKGGLDGRAAKVRAQLDEATALRAEAQRLLDLYRSKQDQAVKDAADILESAKTEAERMGPTLLAQHLVPGGFDRIDSRHAARREAAHGNSGLHRELARQGDGGAE